MKELPDVFVASEQQLYVTYEISGMVWILN